MYITRVNVISKIKKCINNCFLIDNLFIKKEYKYQKNKNIWKNKILVVHTDELHQKIGARNFQYISCIWKRRKDHKIIIENIKIFRIFFFISNLILNIYF